MATDSNVMTNLAGGPLPHFTQYSSPMSLGVNFFAQDLSSTAPFIDVCYAFPFLALVGPRYENSSEVIYVSDSGCLPEKILVGAHPSPCTHKRLSNLLLKDILTLS